MLVRGYRRGIVGTLAAGFAVAASALAAAPALADAPDVTGPADFSINEDQTRVLSAANGAFTVSDPDPGDLTIDIDASNGVINLATTSGLTNLSGDGTNDVHFEGDATEVNAAIDGMSFVPASNFNGGAGIVVNADDGTTADNDAVAITVTAVNDNPVNSLPGTQSTNEDVPLTLSGGNAISVSDVDAAGDAVQVALNSRNPGDPNNDSNTGTIQLDGTAGLTVTSGANGTNSVTVQGTLADLNAALDGMTFTPTANRNGSSFVRVNTSDLGHNPTPARTDADDLTINLTAVDNDPPQNKFFPGIGTYKNVPKTFSVANRNQFSIFDPDGNDSTTDDLSVDLTSTHGTMTLASTTNLSVTGNGTSAVAIQGDRTDVGGALDTGLTYAPDSGFTGTGTITLETDDLTGGGTDTDIASVRVDNPEDTVYWATSKNTLAGFPGGIGRAELDGGGGAHLVSGPETEDIPIGTAIDAVAGKIYWSISPTFNTTPSIYRANLDGTGKELFATAAIVGGAGAKMNSLGAMAIDQTTRRIYWANANASPGGSADRGISYTSLDTPGTAGTTGFIPANGQSTSSPRGLAIDLDSGYAYYTNVSNSSVGYVPLPGSGGSSGNFAVTGTVSQAQGIARDPNSNRIFWTNGTGDTASQRLKVATLGLPGSNALSASTFDISPSAGGGLRTPAIDPEANRIYYANSATNQISFANLDGTGSGADLATGTSTVNSPDGISILKSPKAANAPSVSGTPEVGQTLTCTAGTWAPDEPGAALYRMPAETTFEWTRNGATIAGATGATHTPDSAGDYRCVSKASNFAGTSTQQSGALSVAAAPDPPPEDPPADPPENPQPPDNDIDLGGAKVEKKNGTAKLSVEVPGAGHLKLHGKDVKTVEHEADGAGNETLKVTATGDAKKKLKKKGKVKVTVQVTFTPNGGEPNTEKKDVTLKQT